MTDEQQAKALAEELATFDPAGLSAGELQEHFADRILAALRAKDARCVELITDAHGNAQESTITDVNAGLIDDLIAPRLTTAHHEGRQEGLREAIKLLQGHARWWAESIELRCATGQAAEEMLTDMEALIDTIRQRAEASAAPQETKG